MVIYFMNLFFPFQLCLYYLYRVMKVSCFSFARWYAKRFLHPDIVAPYDYIFIWDEDLGVDDFDFEE